MVDFSEHVSLMRWAEPDAMCFGLMRARGTLVTLHAELTSACIVNNPFIGYRTLGGNDSSVLEHVRTWFQIVGQ